jgi:hypothetical protein
MSHTYHQYIGSVCAALICVNLIELQEMSGIDGFNSLKRLTVAISNKICRVFLAMVGTPYRLSMRRP